MAMHRSLEATFGPEKPLEHGNRLFRGRASYTAEAVALWKHRLPTHSTELDYLVHYARLAANAHNTQPWLFGKTDATYIIKPDFRRRTPVVDPDDHHLFASLGCAAENLTLAAKETGKDTSVIFHPTTEEEIHIHLATGKTLPSPLFEAIIARQCTRSNYSGQTVPSAHLKSLSMAAKIQGCGLILITEPPKIAQILDLIVSANSAQIRDPAFVSELKSWLRFNAASAVATHDGLYAPCSGNPDLPDWISGPVFRLLFTAKSENRKCISQVRSSSGLAIFISDKNDREHWVKAGRSFQRFALQATLLNIKHAFLNQPVEVPHYRQELASLLGIGDKRPDFLVRFGYADPMPRSLRRPVNEVLF